MKLSRRSFIFQGIATLVSRFLPKKQIPVDELITTEWVYFVGSKLEDVSYDDIVKKNLYFSDTRVDAVFQGLIDQTRECGMLDEARFETADRIYLAKKVKENIAPDVSGVYIDGRYFGLFEDEGISVFYSPNGEKVSDIYFGDRFAFMSRGS